MDSLSYIPIGDANGELLKELYRARPLEGPDRDILIRTNLLNRHLLEISQLYSVYRWNYDLYVSVYDRNIGDLIRFRVPQADAGIAANALFTNLVSSGRALVDRLQNSYGDFNEGECFKGASEVYDRKSTYSLFYEFRNECQHGQTVVSVADGKLGFDLRQILSPEKYSVKKKLRERLEEIATDIESSGCAAVLSFTASIEKFNIEVHEIYLSFLNGILDSAKASAESMVELVDANPCSVACLPDGTRFVSYEDGSDCHITPLTDGCELDAVAKAIDRVSDDLERLGVRTFFRASGS